MFSFQSFAAVGDKVEAMFANFNLVINGQVKSMDTTPLVYNGTSYLPVREISNLVGYDVTYKADSRTIELSNGSKSVTDNVYGKKSVTDSVYGNVDMPFQSPSPTAQPTPIVSPIVSSVPTPIVNNQNLGSKIKHVDIKEIQLGDDGAEFIVDNNIDYISLMTIAKTYDPNGYSFRYNSKDKTIDLTTNDEVGHPITKSVTILINIPYRIFDNKTYIDYSYYKNTLINLLNKRY